MRCISGKIFSIDSCTPERLYYVECYYLRMNKFVRYKSISFLILTWISLIALFADGSNVTDIFSGTVTLHSDDDYASISLESGNTHGLLPITNDGAFSTTPHPSKKSGGKIPTAVPQIIYDEDSPSLVGASFKNTLESSMLCEHHPVDYAIDLSSDPLYLRYRKLLI